MGYMNDRWNTRAWNRVWKRGGCVEERRGYVLLYGDCPYMLSMGAIAHCILMSLQYQPHEVEQANSWEQELLTWLPSSWHMGSTVWSINLMSTNGPVITYLSLVAFAVRWHSWLDHHLTKPPLSAWWLPFLHFHEGESAAVFPSVLPLWHPPPCISRLVFCKTGSDHWQLSL